VMVMVMMMVMVMVMAIMMVRARSKAMAVVMFMAGCRYVQIPAYVVPRLLSTDIHIDRQKKGNQKSKRTKIQVTRAPGANSLFNFSPRGGIMAGTPYTYRCMVVFKMVS
jgi:hypothetical protein